MELHALARHLLLDDAESLCLDLLERTLMPGVSVRAASDALFSRLRAALGM